ncbi:MAG TPA: hypothetical protein VNT30_07890 [Stellaceae bacterium]|nr:hypothetical protein [Stellaceae bacterium]
MGDDPAPRPAIAGLIATLRDGFAILREAVIVGVILFFIVNPGRVSAFLEARGVHNLNVMGIDVSLDQFHSQARAVDAIEQAVESPDLPEATRTQLGPALQTLNESLASLGKAINQADPAALPRSGWVLLGLLDAAGTGFQKGPALHVDVAWPLTIGRTVTLSSSVGLRQDTPPPHNRAPIVSVLPTGTVVKIEDLQQLPVTLGSGKTVTRVWAKVSAQS